MSFIQREIDRIRILLTPQTHERHKELYAAQQALEWALEPNGVASPYSMITGNEPTSESDDAIPS